MKKLILSTLLVGSLYSFSQDYYYNEYNWQSKPISYTPNELEKEEESIIIKSKRSTEFVIPKTEEAPYFVNLDHKVVFLNSDNAVEEYNKLMISGNVIEEYELKARVITSKGEVIELDESNVQVAEDDEGNDLYKYFAFDGVDIGSTVEFFRIYKTPADLTGREVRLQGSSIWKNIEFDFITPEHLEFEFYSINGLPSMEKDSLLADESRFYVRLDSMPGLKDEKQAENEANLKKLYYKLSKNINSGSSNFYSYTNVGNNIYNSFYEKASKKDQKAVKKFIKAAEIEDEESTKSKVRKLENYIKTNLNIIDVRASKLEDLNFVLKNEITNDDGATKLMLLAFKQMGIKHELIVTCNRFENRFETEFEGYNFLRTFLIYIKELDNYLIPDEITSRLGVIPSGYLGQKGLFIREKKIGDYYAPISEVKTIHYNDMDDSHDDLKVLLTFEDDMSAKVSVDRTVSGYKANYFQGVISYVDIEEREEFKNSLINFIDDESTPEETSFENFETNDLGLKALNGKGIIKSEVFTENAGNKTLVKVGKLIGPQAEMYNTKERKQAVRDYFKRVYNREIKIQIPEGYEFNNLEELNMNVTMPNEKEAGFVSSYKIEGDVLIITVTEYYDKVEYSIDEYQDYENIINAAADFNKLVIVLNKK